MELQLLEEAITLYSKKELDDESLFRILEMIQKIII
jgi:hypothetical protein